MAEQPRTFNYDTRLSVADAFMDLANVGGIAPEVTDEIIPRLLPEAYPDLAAWNVADMPPTMAAVSNEALKTLTDKKRLSKEQADQARVYLGTLTTAA